MLLTNYLEWIMINTACLGKQVQILREPVAVRHVPA